MKSDFIRAPVVAPAPDSIRADRNRKCQPNGMNIVSFVHSTDEQNDRGGLFCAATPPPRAMLGAEERLVAAGRFVRHAQLSDVPAVENLSIPRGFPTNPWL